MMPVRIGIGGGVFDPIHIGHLFLFNECADRIGLDRVLLIPAFRAVHKDSDAVTGYEHRREMVRLACKSNPIFHLSEIEREAGGPSYTIQTIRALKTEEPDADWYFIVGLDNLEKMEDWYRPDEIVEEVTVVVGSRPVESVPQKSRLMERVVILDIPKLDISSTDIRARITAKRSIKYLVSTDVEEYIRSNNLYSA